MRRRLLSVTIVVSVVLVFSGAQASGSDDGLGDGSVRIEHASWGCIKALYRGAGFPSRVVSESGGIGNQVRYPVRDSPEHALQKLVEAYNAMDADAFIDCLSDTFSFWLNEQDVIDDPTLPCYWDVAIETGMHWNMFGGGSIESIWLILTQHGEAVELPPGVPGGPSAWEYRENYDLSVYLSAGLMLWSDEGAVFRLSVDPDGVGPSGEELWEVSRWSDVDEFAGSPVDELRWGRINTFYRLSREMRARGST